MIAETWSYDNAKSLRSRAKIPPASREHTRGKVILVNWSAKKPPVQPGTTGGGHRNNLFITGLRAIGTQGAWGSGKGHRMPLEAFMPLS